MVQGQLMLVVTHLFMIYKGLQLQTETLLSPFSRLSPSIKQTKSSRLS